MKISGQKAIVIGGAQGIGLAYTKLLLNNGATVVMGDIQEEKGLQEVKTLKQEHGDDRIYFIGLDITKTSQVTDFFKNAQSLLGEINIVVGNAAVIDEHNWAWCIDVNFLGVIRISEEAFKYMGKQHGGKGGVMIHTASISGLRPDAWGPVYCATKHAVVAYCRAWALEKNYKEHGVRINVICPTTVDTPFLQQTENAFHADENREYLKTVDRLRPDEIAEVLQILLEDDTYNGTAMRISKQHGIDVATFQNTPLQ